MIGDEYFHLRTRLSSELHALAEVIRDTGGDTEAIAITENLIASLKDPFVFVVVGEVNVGKSTFLNALFGQDFSRTGVMPTTDKIYFFKHGQTHQIVPVTSTLDEVQVPLELLKDFHIVDTPGTNSIENEHQEITERFVPIADLVIFVFSAMNPWGASAWQFLDKVHRHWMRHVIFVLQQCDLRSPEEIQVITDYMGQLSRQRYGQDFPLFAVSGRNACLARKVPPGEKERMLEESGFLALEQHVSTLVGQNAARLNKLSSTVRLARQLLNHLRDNLNQQTRAAQQIAAMVQEFLTEREMQVDRTLKKILPALDATERDYHESCVRIAEMADDVLSTGQAFKNEHPDDEEIKPESLDHRLFQELQHRSGDRWRQVGIILEEDYLQYERFLYAQGRGTLFAADAPLPAESNPDLRRLFAVHIDSTIRRFVLGLKLDETIEPGLLRARQRARWVPWMILPILAAVGASWYFDGPIGAAISGAGGMLLLGFALLITQTALNQTRGELADHLEVSTVKLREMLQAQVQQDVASLFGRFLPMLEPAQVETASREQQLLIQTERMNALSESLHTFQRELAH